MASRKELEAKDEKREDTSSSHPAGFFTKVPRLQNMVIEDLLTAKGGLQKLLEYIKTDNALSDPVRGVLKNACRPKLIQELSQAVIDDDIQAVKVILDFDPELLLVDPASENVTEIESKKTWQRFLTEQPFIMAQKLKRLEMTKTLLPYLEELQKNGIKIKTTDKKDEEGNLLNQQWVLPYVSEKEQKELDKKQRNEYMKYLTQLITTITTDNLAKVKWGENKETKLYEARMVMSDATKLALVSFRKQLLPDQAVAIDKYFDIEQFLIAAFEAFDTYYDTFQNDQRAIYAIRVIGLIQSLVSPELAKVYCESLYDVIRNNQPIGAQAEGLKLKGDGRAFYRSSRDSEEGLGFSFLITGGGGIWVPEWYWSGNRSFLKNYITQKHQAFETLCTKHLLKMGSNSPNNSSITKP